MRLRNFFLLAEMPRGRGDPTWAMLDWCYQQTQPFTIKQALEVYVANGGRAKSDDPKGNLGSFTSLFQGFVAKKEKEGMKPKPGKGPYWPPSERRPLVKVSGRGKGYQGEHAGMYRWALDKPLRDPSTARFVNPADDKEEETAGDAMDRLEDEQSGIGAAALVAAMKRWKKMTDINVITADIKAHIPKRLWVDAMQVAWDQFSPAQKDSEELASAEDELDPAHAPHTGHEFDDEDEGEFSSSPEPEPFDPEEPDEEEPPPPPVKKPAVPAPAPKAAVPEPEDDEEEDDIEEPTKQQAGAANFLKPSTPAPSPAKPKSPLSKWMKRR